MIPDLAYVSNIDTFEQVVEHLYSSGFSSTQVP